MESCLSCLPEKPGVYLFRDKSGQILYVGKANNLRARVRAYLKTKFFPNSKTAALVTKIAEISHFVVPSELEALLLEAHLIKTHQPFFNIRAKDDKHPLYIKVTQGEDEYSRVFLVHKEEEPGSVYFGPFPSTRTIRRVLRFLRHIFPFDTQKTIGKKACFWSHLGLCLPCPSVIKSLPVHLQKKEKARYRKNIRWLVAVLSRRTEKVKKMLRGEMEKAAKRGRFEEAAQLRDQLRCLEYVTAEYRNPVLFLNNPHLIEDAREKETQALTSELQPYFRFKKTISRLECFDASHTTMTNPTVGMVTFINGEPEKSLYRRFRIREKVFDDLSFLAEALRRRLGHQDWELPDLLVIDGGKPQIKRTGEVLKELNIHLPVVGLVKPFDNLILSKTEGVLILRVQDPGALSLLRRLRDETHRFAVSYHRKLRAKSFLGYSS